MSVGALLAAPNQKSVGALLAAPNQNPKSQTKRPWVRNTPTAWLEGNKKTVGFKGAATANRFATS